MAFISGTSSQGEAITHSVALACDACGKRAARHEAPTFTEATRLARKSAEEEGFVIHGRGRRWLCPACRLRTLPAHLQRLFPRLLARYDVVLPADDQPATAKPKRARRRG